MFTGIVEEVGRITRIEQRGENRRITVTAEHAPKELRTGHSVAVSGVCLRPSTSSRDPSAPISRLRPGCAHLSPAFTKAHW